MNLDALGRLHAKQARNTVTDATLPPIEQIIEGRSSGRMVAALAWVAAAAMAVVVAVLVASPAPDLTPTTLAPVSGDSTTTTAVSTSTTMILPAGAWNPILATTQARPAPPAATCPPGSDPNLPGPSEQERPRAEYNWLLKGVFDQHTGRIVYLDTAGETWMLDVCTNTWQNMHPESAPAGAGGFDGAGRPDGAIISLVYDADSDVTVAFGYERVSVYDANANTWTQLENETVGIGDGLIVPYGFAYDPISGLILTTRQIWWGEPSEQAGFWELWAYDVDTNNWTLVGTIAHEPTEAQRIGNDDEWLELLGYSSTLDRLIFDSSNEETVLVDPRTGESVAISTDTPVIDLGWPNGVYGPAADTVYVKLGGDDICGFDTSTLTWSLCFDTPATLRNNQHVVFAAMVGDPINQRLILINGVGGDWSVNATDDVWAIDLDTGEWTQLLASTTP